MMFSANRMLISCAAAALVVAGSSQSVRSQSKEPIKIGFVTELSGAWSFYGNACVQGLRIAETKINAAGGALGRPLEFMVVDDRTNPAEALAAARKLDAQDHVVALSGPTNSDATLAIYGYVEQNKLPFIAATSTPQITKPGTRYTYRVYPAENVGLGVAAAKLIAQKKPKAKVALIYSDFAVMRVIFAGFKYEGQRDGIEVVSETLLPQGTTDVTVQIAQIVAAKPDFVLPIGAGALDNTITTQLIQFGIKPNQIVHAYGNPMTVAGWGPTSVGSIYGTHFDPKQDKLTAEGQQFIKEFAAQAGRLPGYTELFCDVIAYVFKGALDKAGSVDREKLRDALSSINMPDPVSGVPIEFDDVGSRKISRYMYMQIEKVDKNDYDAKQIGLIEWKSGDIPIDKLAP
jgi:branched-chain amino acid transport system substrate-binding protein